VIIGNRKLKPLLKFKTGNNNFITTIKVYNASNPVTKNNNADSKKLPINKILNLKNLKISQHITPFPKQTFACTRQIFTVGFIFIFFFYKECPKKTFDF
jgi:hypothetical protein